jgi:hypothetical protein
VLVKLDIQEMESIAMVNINVCLLELFSPVKLLLLLFLWTSLLVCIFAVVVGIVVVCNLLVIATNCFSSFYLL